MNMKSNENQIMTGEGVSAHVSKNKNDSFQSLALNLLRRVESGNRTKYSKGIRADPKA